MPACLFAASPARGDDGGWRDGITLIASEHLRGELVDWFRPRAGAADPGAHRYDFVASQLRAGFTLVPKHAQLTIVAQDARLTPVRLRRVARTRLHASIGISRGPLVA